MSIAFFIFMMLIENLRNKFVLIFYSQILSEKVQAIILVLEMKC